MSIYIVMHKKCEIPNFDNYIPIQVGACFNEDLGCLRDDYGDNISEKNKNYCELTALYEIWKNEPAQDFVGMVHYRRYFYRKKVGKSYYGILQYKECVRMIEKKYDIILPEKRYFNCTVREQYMRQHNIKDLDNCRSILESKYRTYLESFDTVMSRRYLFPYNMFVTNWTIFDDYMNWLFDILFCLEKQTNLWKYDDYNRRIYGFLAERLFNVWIQKNNLKIKMYPVINVEETIIHQVGYIIKNSIKKEISKIKSGK